MSSGKNKNKPQSAPAESPKSEVRSAFPGQGGEFIAGLRTETLTWALTILSALAVYMVIALLIHSSYHPDTRPAFDLAKKLLLVPETAKPEPVEALLFRSGVVVLGLGMLGFYALYSRMKQVAGWAAGPAGTVLVTACVVVIALLIWYDFSAPNPFYSPDGKDIQNARDYTAKSNFDFFFGGFFLGNNIIAYTFLIVPAIAALFFFGFRKLRWDESKIFNAGTFVVGFTITGGTVLACVLMSVFYFPYAYENKYDFNAVYYSMTQVHAGIPLLVNNFTSTYGLYPHFLNIIFFFTGLSIFKFSLVLALLIGLAFVFNYLSLNELVGNKVILFLGMLTIIFFPFLDYKYGQNFDCNFAFYPIRYIIPSTLIFLSGLYLRSRSQMQYLIIMVVMSLFVLWNPEFGLVCYLSWLVMNTYTDFFTKEQKVNFMAIARHWAVGIGVLVAVFYLYKFVIYALYGVMPDMSLLFSTISVFAQVGSSLLPMVLVHPWNLMAIVILLGLLYAISKWYRKEVTPKASLVLLISLLSIGFFVYFQGRSHNWQLAQSSCMTLILLTILGDELWDKVKQSNLLPLNLLFVVFLFGASFSLFEIMFNTDKINDYIYQEEDKEKQQGEQQQIEMGNNFILNNSKDGQKIYVFTAKQYQSLYFSGNKRIAAINPGLGDLFLKSDMDKLVDQLRDSSYTVFIEPAFCNYQFLTPALAAMSATYEVKAAEKTMACLEKQKDPMPVNNWFNHSIPPLVHRTYSRDMEGRKKRISDDSGIEPVKLNQEFSVEVFFEPKPQIYPYATLVGNMDDTSGFIICNVINTPNYFFGINGKGIAYPLPKSGWIYCAMNVFPDHIEMYCNGLPVGGMPLAGPMKQSPQKLTVGNSGFLRNYFGEISEVAVNNRVLDKSEIADTWGRISGH